MGSLAAPPSYSVHQRGVTSTAVMPPVHAILSFPPADGIHAEMLEEGNIILAKPSDTMQSQPFRIYKITTPKDGKLEVQARHISYQLNFITVSPFSVTGCAGAMQGLKSHAASDCPFDVWTDVDSSATFTLGIPSSFRNCLGGIAGSVP